MYKINANLILETHEIKTFSYSSAHNCRGGYGNGNNQATIVVNVKRWGGVGRKTWNPPGWRQEGNRDASVIREGVVLTLNCGIRSDKEPFAFGTWEETRMFLWEVEDEGAQWVVVMVYRLNGAVMEIVQMQYSTLFVSLRDQYPPLGSSSFTTCFLSLQMICL